MNKRLKRYLFLLHRWFGIAMCLLFALWFASGIIMMYVEYPELTEAERLDMLPALAPEQVRLDAGQALAAAGLEGEADAIRLNMVRGRPAYWIRDEAGRQRTVFADSGEVLESLSPAQALAALQHSGFLAKDADPLYQGRMDMDQWTVSSSLDGLRPLHKVAAGDAAGTVVYVSDVTGQIVRDTRRGERFWNWLGSTIHWIYPMQLRRHVDLWVDVIIYLSLAGIVSVLTGGIIGFMRLRIAKPYGGERMTPYRGVGKWHHVLGLASLVFVSTFIFSGLMSMNPWGIFDSDTSAEEQIGRFTGGSLGTPAQLPRLDSRLLDGAVKEVEWRRIGGQGYLVLSRAAGDRQAVSGEGDPLPLRHEIERNVSVLLPDAPPPSLTVLNAYDDYYYSRHNRYRPLPVLRAQFADAENTWYYIDLHTGAVVHRLTDGGRAARWLYNGLHSLDFSFLWQHRPAWDLTVILLSIVGLIFSVTSVMIGWRRLLQ